MHIYPKRASLEGREIEIFKLVSYSATPEQWKEWLRVPLEHAAARGKLDLFNKLLGAGASGSAGWRGCRDRTLLDAAAVGGNEEVVTGLLLAGARPDVQVVSCSSKRSALYTATALGHEAVARHLIIAGADVNFQDPMDKRPILYEAIRGGHKRLATELLIGGANPNCRNAWGVSPLHFAAEKGFDGIVSTLLLKGADKDALDDNKETPLVFASEHGRLSVVKTLLAAGVDVNVRGLAGYSVLECAATQGHGDVVEAIVGHGADVNTAGEKGCTALHIAAWYDKADAVEALIKARAEVELQTDDGFTPLATAANTGSCKSLLVLLQHGGKVDVREADGDTPLHLACTQPYKRVDAVVDLLLRWGADERAVNNNDQIPAEILDVVENTNLNIRATQDEIDRTRLLLSRAPADRAWRRRGWLAMLRARTEAKRARCSDKGRPEGEGFKVARRDGAGSRCGHVAHGQTNKDFWTDEGDGKGEALSGVVALLVEIEPEGVFRTIVRYL